MDRYLAAIMPIFGHTRLDVQLTHASTLVDQRFYGIPTINYGTFHPGKPFASL